MEGLKWKTTQPRTKQANAPFTWLTSQPRYHVWIRSAGMDLANLAGRLDWMRDAAAARVPTSQAARERSLRKSIDRYYRSKIQDPEVDYDPFILDRAYKTLAGNPSEGFSINNRGYDINLNAIRAGAPAKQRELFQGALFLEGIDQNQLILELARREAQSGLARKLYDVHDPIMRTLARDDFAGKAARVGAYSGIGFGLTAAGAGLMALTQNLMQANESAQARQQPLGSEGAPAA